MSRRTRLALALALVLLVGFLTRGAWGSSLDRERLVRALAPEDGGGHGGAPPVWRSIEDLLPNVHYRGPHHHGPLAESVVVGHFTAVEKGRGWRGTAHDEQVDGHDGLETSFDDPQALWRTLHARFEVESVVAGAQPGRSLGVCVPWWSEPFDTAEDGYPALGRVVLFASPGSNSCYYDSALSGSAYLAVVDDDGRLSMPLVSDDHERQLLSRTTTPDGLHAAAEAPRPGDRARRDGGAGRLRTGAGRTAR